jgi:hypothetical protein
MTDREQMARNVFGDEAEKAGYKAWADAIRDTTDVILESDHVAIRAMLAFDDQQRANASATATASDAEIMREACAKVADEVTERARINVQQLTGPSADPDDQRSHYLWAQQTAERIAAAIRIIPINPRKQKC